MDSSIIKQLASLSSVRLLITVLIALIFLIIVSSWISIHPLAVIGWVWNRLSKLMAGVVNKHEMAYHRDLEIGKIDSKRRKVKLYKFLSDLIIDLGMTDSGIKPYELLYSVLIIVAILDLFVSKVLFGNFLISIILYPIITVGIFCALYTKANIAHDRRIEAVVEAENVICNNIRSGVLVAVKETLDVIPKEVRPDFKDFIDSVEQKNTHIKTALVELNLRLGSIADDFIKKCIVYELEEEHGISEMFKDIVEVNNIKSEMRITIKRKLDRVVNDFKISATMIFVFLLGVLFIYPDVRTWYFTTVFGQAILAADILLLIIEYVYITYLRAKEL